MCFYHIQKFRSVNGRTYRNSAVIQPMTTNHDTFQQSFNTSQHISPRTNLLDLSENQTIPTMSTSCNAAVSPAKAHVFLRCAHVLHADVQNWNRKWNWTTGQMDNDNDYFQLPPRTHSADLNLKNRGNDTLRKNQPTSIRGLALRTWMKGHYSAKKKTWCLRLWANVHGVVALV